jgi:hypothetical protein
VRDSHSREQLSSSKEISGPKTPSPERVETAQFLTALLLRRSKLSSIRAFVNGPFGVSNVPLNAYMQRSRRDAGAQESPAPGESGAPAHATSDPDNVAAAIERRVHNPEYTVTLVTFCSS